MDLLRARLCPKPVEPVEPVELPFTTLYPIAGSRVRTILRAAFPMAQIKVADKTYKSPTLDEFNTWIIEDCVSQYKYFADWFDCDNFARFLRCAMFKINLSYKTEITMPYCEGDSPSGYHAFNILVDNTDNIFVVEPQDDVIVPYEKSVYKPDFIQL